MTELKGCALDGVRSPGVASQMPVKTFSPFEASSAHALKAGLPEISRSGVGNASFGAKLGFVSMVVRSDMSFSSCVNNLAFGRSGRSVFFLRDDAGYCR